MKNLFNSSLDGVQSSKIRQFSALAASTPGCVSLTLGEPDFDTPEEISFAAISSLQSGNTHYIANNGDNELKKVISAFEAKKHNLYYSKDEIIVTIGATQAIFATLFAILNPGDEVIILAPAFGLYEETVKLLRGRPVKVDLKGSNFQVTKEQIEGAITSKTKAVIINSPNNPTGGILSEESLKNIYNAVKSNDIFVLCDDVYRDILYTSDYHSFAEFEDLRHRIIVIQSFSKPYAMTGWRLGYIMADGQIIEKIAPIHQYNVVSSVSFLQQSGIAALNCDVSKMKNEYKKRRDYILNRLDKMNMSYPEPLGGFYVFPSIEQFGLSSDEFCRKMIKDAKLAVTPGDCFGCGGHIRLTYCYSMEELKEGMNRLERFLTMLL